ncbi:MAG: LarC family nickel insertion protein [Clostridia bacterium]|nr:LarC family nickel insertion protein [Clostridia bacterium]
MKDKIILLETNIDDCSGEVLGYTLEKLMDAGAKDAWFSPIYMKKSRPAYALSVMCKPEQEEELVKIIFKHTSAVGMRRSEVDRVIMDREPTIVETAYGTVKANKFSYEDIEKTSLEYADVKRLADEKDISINEIYKTIRP